MDEKYFTCEIHKQGFLTIEALKKHVIQDHSNEAQLKCQECNKRFKSALQLERHKANKHETTQNGKKRRNPENLNQEVLETPTAAHEELLQGKSTNTVIPEVKAETSFQCHICSTFFAGESTLSQHLLSHLEDRPLFTSGDLAYETSNNLKLELELVKESNSSQEDVKPTVGDNRHQKTWRKLRGNEGVTSFRRQTKAIGYVCHLCSKTFKTRFARIKHVSIEHSDHHLSNDEADEDYKPNDEPVVSSEEDTDYEIEKDSRSSCSDHSKGDHNQERPFKCNLCNNSFHAKRSLKSHMQIHSCEQKHVCKTCNKSFKRQWDLNRHVLTFHSEQNRFKCNVCGNSFNRKDAYNRHMKHHELQGPRLKPLVYHSQERSFKCNLCNNSFHAKRSLKSHMQIHSCEQKHVCKTCNKSFKRQWDLNRHVLTYHSEQNRFKCSFCGKGFYRKDMYDQHRKRPHVHSFGASIF